MRGPAPRLGQVAKVVHAANGPATEATPLQITLPRTGIHRRFPGRAGAGWATGYPQGLPPSSKTNTAVAGRARPHSSSHEGRVERSNSDRELGSCGRFEANEIFLGAAQDRKSTIYGHKTAAASPCGSALGVPRPAGVVRRHVCFLILAMPFARFYTTSVYWDMGRRSQSRRNCERCRTRLTYQSIRDLRFSRVLTCAEKDGQEIRPPGPSNTLHTDAADIGFGGTLGPDTGPGAPGLWEAQGVCGWRDRAQGISLRELMAIRLLLTRSLGRRLKEQGLNRVLFRCDNLAVVHITNAMVTASRGRMRELRKLSFGYT